MDIEIGDIIYPFMWKECGIWKVYPIQVFGGYKCKFLPHTTVHRADTQNNCNYIKNIKWYGWTNNISTHGHGLKAFIKDFEYNGCRQLKDSEALEVIVVRKKSIVVKIVEFKINFDN